jgi:hypothetical protein
MRSVVGLLTTLVLLGERSTSDKPDSTRVSDCATFLWLSGECNKRRFNARVLRLFLHPADDNGQADTTSI